MDNELIKRLKKERIIKKIRYFIDHFPLFWIFDQRVKETHRMGRRCDDENRKRSLIRHFFSWDNLTTLTASPVLTAGLASIFFTPLLAHIFISSSHILGNRIAYNFPLQMTLLFFSGLVAIIAKFFHAIWCPYFIKESKIHNNIERQSVFILERASRDFMHCIGQLIRVEHLSPEDIHYLNNKKSEQEVAVYLMCNGMPCKRVGFDPYGMWAIENIAYNVAKILNFKLYTKHSNSSKYVVSYGATTVYTCSRISLFKSEISLKKPCDAEGENYEEDAIYLSFYEADTRTIDNWPKNKSIENYIHGINHFIDIVPFDLTKKIISQMQNYQSPFKRVWLSMLISTSIGLLILFLFIQAKAVINAISL